MSTPSTADLLLVNADVVTMDTAGPTTGAARPSAVAVRDGLVVAVGDDALARQWRGAGTTVVDLHGAAVTPGLVDGHTHPLLGLATTTGVDLSGCATLAQVREALAAAGRQGDGEWVLGWGLDPNALDGAPITADLVEDAVGGRPASLALFDGHSALVTREALRRAGISGPRAFRSTAAVVCDAGGAPTGHLLEESAVDLVRAVIPAVPTAQRRAQLRRVLDGMAATGLTGGHAMDLDGGPGGLDLLRDLEDADQLPLRLRLAPWCRPEDDDRLPELIALQHEHGRLWEVSGVKLFVDGTIDGGTAWLHSPDRHGQSTRSYWLDPADYTRAVRALDAAGVPTATHAIGDAAVTHVLDTLAGVSSAAGTSSTADGHGPGRQRPRHRVEHIETLPADQARRFGQLGVIASMQPTHATDYTLADHTDNWSRRLGDQRADRAWPCRDVLDGGATLVLGSDWPVAPYDPRLTLAAAQLRRPAHRPDLAPVNPAQALTAHQALAGYTTAPAFAAGAEARAGRVRVGSRADLTVFAADPLRVPATEVADVPVVATVVDGRIRHRAPELRG